jgi:hypothetical protein
MFGIYDVPLKIDKGGISLSIKKKGEGLVYKRESAGEIVEKLLLTESGNILVNPVEPLNTPETLTSNFLIELEESLIVEPRATRKIFLTFPIEIGIFISKDKRFEILDIFSLEKQKFTLYGNPRGGVICKYWMCKVHPTEPSKDPLHQGIMELSVKNQTPRWSQINQAVFNAYRMKLYFNENIVSMRAKMEIIGEDTAETEFVDSPLKHGMTKSLETYVVGTLDVRASKFLMEAGI